MRLLIGAGITAAVLLAQPPFGGFGGPGGPGFGAQERKVLKDHDKNNDGRLDKAERTAAREALAKDPPRGFGGRGGPRFGGNSTPPQPGPKVKVSDAKAYGKESLYDPKVLRTIFLEFEDNEWEKELAAFNNTDVELPARVTVDGKIYNDVGVHFRGMSSFMMVGEGRKRSLNLSFDFVNKDQRLLGYRTLNLNNAFGDPTFLRPVLYSVIARDYLPAPNANYMRVVINGELWGIYINAQQFNADFLNEWFKTKEGNRWKAPGSPGGRAGLNYLGEDVEEYKKLFQIKSKDNKKAWTDLMHLTKVLTETPVDQLETALKPIFDTDGALRFLAVEKALINSDGYWTRASDYSLYQDPKGVFHVIPHDMNEGMRPPEMMGGGRGGFRGPGGPGGPGGPPPGGFPQRPPADAKLDPFAGSNDANKVLISRLLQVPAFRARYLGYMKDIAEKWLDWKKLAPLASSYQALIANDVKADTRKLFSTEDFTKAVADDTEEQGPFPGAPARRSMSLKSFVEQRQEYLLSHPDVKAAKRN